MHLLGLSLIFEVGGDIQEIAGIRVVVVKSTCWIYIKVVGDTSKYKGKTLLLMEGILIGNYFEKHQNGPYLSSRVSCTD